MFHYPDKNQAVFKNLNLPALKKLICLLSLTLKSNFYFLNFLSGSAEIINCFFIIPTCTVSVDSLCGKSVQSLQCNTAFAPL